MFCCNVSRPGKSLKSNDILWRIESVVESPAIGFLLCMFCMLQFCGSDYLSMYCKVIVMLSHRVTCFYTSFLCILYMSVNNSQFIWSTLIQYQTPVQFLVPDIYLGCNQPPGPTQPSIPPGSLNDYHLRLGRQRQVWFIPLVDERGVSVVQVKLWDPLRTRAVPEHLRGVFTTRCYTFPLLPLPLPLPLPLRGGQPAEGSVLSGIFWLYFSRTTLKEQTYSV